MEWLRIFGVRFGGLFRKRNLDRDLDAEIRAHLEMLAEDNIRRGMNPAEARYAARREFGGVEQAKETYRDQRGLPFLDARLLDLRFAFRALANKPGFALVAILTLTVGIGSTSAVFSVVDRLLFRSLPYPNDDQIVSFGDKAPFESLEFVLGPDYLDWRDKQTPFAVVTSMHPGIEDCDLAEQNPARLGCAAVEASFLPTFGIQPLLGRNFTVEEDRPGAPRVALLSYGLWITRFGRDSGVIGKNISLDGRATRLIGILPADFELPNLARFDLLVPQALNPSKDRGPNARQIILEAFARLKPGVTAEQASAAMQPLFQDSLNYVPPQFRNEVSFRLRPLRERQVEDSRLASWVLLGSVLAVLLVACTNVANLLLARATGRQRELAVRVALGATRLRLLWQALTESLLLGVLGGAGGCWFAFFLLRLFVSIAPEGIPRLQQAYIDVRVLVFTLAVSLLSGVLFGLAPALRQPHPEALTGKEVRVTTRSLLRQGLVSVQIGVSLVLLAGAGLLLRSLWKLETVSLGMATESIMTAEISLGDYRYSEVAAQLDFFRQLESRLKQLPGLAAVAVSDSLPPFGRSQATFLTAIEVPGHARFAEGTGGMIGWRIVTPDYFAALGIPFLAGRNFREEDRSSPDMPVILSEALAKRLFPSEDPLGKPIRFGYQAPWRTIVGVARNVKNNGLSAPGEPEFYILWKEDRQGFYRNAHFTLRSQVPPAAMAQWIRSEAAALDPTLPVKIESMTRRVDKLAERPRFNAVLLTLFAGMGVLLAAIGIYGVVGYMVAERTQEIGVRMALGAAPATILKMVLSSVARWTVAGALFGLLGTWLGTRLLESLLFDVRPHDPVLLGLALLVLLAVVILAAWIPARRAMRIDPMVALRYE
jgi:putative ABC transport system permease protein